MPFRILSLIALLSLTASCQRFTGDNADSTLNRVWIGPEYYANRLMDWRLQDGRIECIEGRSAKPMRTLHSLTQALGEESGNLVMSVQTGPIAPADTFHQNTWSGFLIGAGGSHVDWRISSLVHHWPAEDGGLIVGIDGTGQIILRDNTDPEAPKGPRSDFTLTAWPLIDPVTQDGSIPGGTAVELRMEATPSENGYQLNVSALDPETSDVLASATYENIPDIHLSGNVALVSHNSPSLDGPGYWFSDWTIEGSKVQEYPDRAFGPVLAALYTLSEGTLKLTAQMPPIGEEDAQEVNLMLHQDGEWQLAATSPIESGSYTSHLRVDGFEAQEDVPYRITYDLEGLGGRDTHTFEGTIRKPRTEDDEFILASLNCQNISRGRNLDWNHSTIWYPHNELTRAVAQHDPDLLFFAGDQIYEGGLAGIIREPVDLAMLDYHYHWYRFIWAFRDLMRDRPTVTIPDDHDVYHGNIWGHGGKKAEGPARPLSDNGGYIMDARFVNMVHRTQVAHLPDAHDPTPIEQDISVYYTQINYGGISFAVVADRMWKSAPRLVLPEADVFNGWPKAPGYDPTTTTEATLLGERQLEFLNEWAHDFSSDDNSWMKVMLSQTLFSNLATLPEGADDDSVVPSMRYPEPGEYVSTDHLGTDMDSNGWPQSGRNRALSTIRKGFAFHVAGDQHLASFVHYGIDDFGDGPNAFISPAIANIWPRRWFPPTAGANRDPGSPAYTGDHFDGFGNRMTVKAVGNPVLSGRTPTELYDRVPGYGIIRFNRNTRQITAEAWPRWVDPAADGAFQYPGWPVTIDQDDNYGRDAEGFLPPFAITGLTDPVVTIVSETTQDTLYTVRISGQSFRAKVFDASDTYSAYIGDQENQTVHLTSLSVARGEEVAPIQVTF